MKDRIKEILEEMTGLVGMMDVQPIYAVGTTPNTKVYGKKKLKKKDKKNGSNR